MKPFERHSLVLVPFPFTDRAAGLPQPCLVRFKVFTLDERLILKTLGHLAPPDRDGVAAQLHQLVD